MELGGRPVPAEHLALLSAEGEGVDLYAPIGASLMILAGEPLREPIAHYGPFVMNTRREIEEAFEDYESGKMGKL